MDRRGQGPLHARDDRMREFARRTSSHRVRYSFQPSPRRGRASYAVRGEGDKQQERPAYSAALYMGILAENGQSVQRPTMRRAAVVVACYSPTAETIATAK